MIESKDKEWGGIFFDRKLCKKSLSDLGTRVPYLDNRLIKYTNKIFLIQAIDEQVQS